MVGPTSLKSSSQTEDSSRTNIVATEAHHLKRSMILSDTYLNNGDIDLDPSTSTTLAEERTWISALQCMCSMYSSSYLSH